MSNLTTTRHPVMNVTRTRDRCDEPFSEPGKQILPWGFANCAAMASLPCICESGAMWPRNNRPTMGSDSGASFSSERAIGVR